MNQSRIDRIQQSWLIGQARGRCLHVGCGSKPIAGAVNIDPNPDRARWVDYPYDVHALPFGDGTFDSILSNHVLPALRDLPVAMHEMIRVLRPGGRMAHVIPAWLYAPRRFSDRHIWDHQHQGWNGPEAFRPFAAQFEELEIVTLESFTEFDWSFKFLAVRR